MTAIIIEPRFHPALRLVVKNVRSKLPNDWKLLWSMALSMERGFVKN